MGLEVYRETLRHLKPDPDVPGQFLLIEPHLLYLTNNQADSYLDLMNNTNYSESFHSDTVKILQRELQHIFPLSQDGVCLIDLGPGYPDKGLPIGVFLKGKGIELDYIPVDVSQRFLQVAAQQLTPFSRSVHPIQSRFENCQALIPKQLYESPTYCMIGLTFMNFVPEKFLPLLQNIAGPCGTVIVASELRTEHKTAEKILQSYQNTEAANLSMGSLLNLGFDRSSLKYEVVFKHSRVEMGFTVLREPPREMRPYGIDVGARVVTAVSYRHTSRSLKDILESHFSSVQMYFSDDQGTVVAVCKNSSALRR